MVELCTDRRQRLEAERLDESCSILPGVFGGASGEKLWQALFMFSYKHAKIENEEGETIWNYSFSFFYCFIGLFNVYLGYKKGVLLYCVNIEYINGWDCVYNVF